MGRESQLPVQFILERPFWDALKRPNSVVFPLYKVEPKQVRDWTFETFDYKPVLKRIDQVANNKGLFSVVGYRLEFPNFDDAVLCRLRWL